MLPIIVSTGPYNARTGCYNTSISTGIELCRGPHLVRLSIIECDGGIMEITDAFSTVKAYQDGTFISIHSRINTYLKKIVCKTSPTHGVIHNTCNYYNDDIVVKKRNNDQYVKRCLIHLIDSPIDEIIWTSSTVGAHWFVFGTSNGQIVFC